MSGVRVSGVIVLLVSAVSAGEFRIDGKLDEAAWRGAFSARVSAVDHIHPNYRAKWSGERDLSFRVRARIHGTDLYVGLEVTDDVRMHVAGREFWAGDSIELFLDTDLQSDEPDDR